jgi:branched-chain amino acid transport system substrate-binding protein
MNLIAKLVSLALFVVAVFVGPATADVIKVGIIAPFSGPYAIWGQQIKNAVGAYVAINGTQAGSHTIEFIYRDTGGVNPDAARAAAQELIVRDGASYLGGFVFTPNTLAVAPLITKAKVPAVIFNAGTSSINKQSEYFLRTSYTLWQVTVPLAEWMQKKGVASVVTAVTDYGPGHDAEAAFTETFEKLGGKTVGHIRMPLATTDFSPFIQKIRDSGAKAIFTFLPAGPPTFAFLKAYNENGLDKAGITFYGTTETDETTIDALGAQAVGLVTALHYSEVHPSKENDALIAALVKIDPRARANFATVGAYDGVHLIYQMAKAAGTDGVAALKAAKGLSWMSPRGPVTLDPETRHVTQDVYLRRVEAAKDGRLVNREFDVVKQVKDAGFAR